MYVVKTLCNGQPQFWVFRDRRVNLPLLWWGTNKKNPTTSSAIQPRRNLSPEFNLAKRPCTGVYHYLEFTHRERTNHLGQVELRSKLTSPSMFSQTVIFLHRESLRMHEGNWNSWTGRIWSLGLKVRLEEIFKWKSTSSVERPSARRHLHRYVTPEWDTNLGEERRKNQSWQTREIDDGKFNWTASSSNGRGVRVLEKEVQGAPHWVKKKF